MANRHSCFQRIREDYPYGFVSSCTIAPDALTELRGDALLALLERHSDVKLFIIDEMSIIGIFMHCIDLRLREIHPQRKHLPFMGVSICLFRDFGQLPPVMDKPMFDTNDSSSSLSKAGRQL